MQPGIGTSNPLMYLCSIWESMALMLPARLNVIAAAVGAHTRLFCATSPRSWYTGAWLRRV
jgi:hypothetical protein